MVVGLIAISESFASAESQPLDELHGKDEPAFVGLASGDPNKIDWYIHGLPNIIDWGPAHVINNTMIGDFDGPSFPNAHITLSQGAYTAGCCSQVNVAVSGLAPNKTYQLQLNAQSTAVVRPNWCAARITTNGAGSGFVNNCWFGFWEEEVRASIGPIESEWTAWPFMAAPAVPLMPGVSKAELAVIADVAAATANELNSRTAGADPQLEAAVIFSDGISNGCLALSGLGLLTPISTAGSAIRTSDALIWLGTTPCVVDSLVEAGELWDTGNVSDQSIAAVITTCATASGSGLTLATGVPGRAGEAFCFGFDLGREIDDSTGASDFFADQLCAHVFRSYCGG